MSAESSLPALRRIVTAHNSGAAVVKSDISIPSTPILPGQTNIRTGGLWTTDATPTNDNNVEVDGATREVPGMLGLVMPHGTNFRFTDLGPGEVVPMHRSTSVDYNILGIFSSPSFVDILTKLGCILVQGELVLILDDGVETHLKNPGDVVIQRGTIHGWRNPSSTWARWACVVVDAVPTSVEGKVLEPLWGGDATDSTKI